MTFIDSHSHLTEESFNLDIDEIIKSLESNNISKSIVIGCSIDDAVKTIELAKRYKNIYPAIGLYPFDEKADENIELEPNHEDILFKKLTNLVESNPEIVGIGECGLDYSEPTPWERYRSKKEQQDLFEKQIELAKNIGKPIIIHSRKAKEDTIAVIRNQYKNNSERNGVWHCYSEDTQTAKEALGLGFYISFSGLITYPKMIELLDTVKQIPLERILIETDAPFLVPHEARKSKIKRNEPKYVKMVAEKIAYTKGISIEKVALQTTANTETLFKI